MAATKKYYVVWEGKQPGIYKTWSECQEQTKGYSGAKFKSFGSLEEAKAAFNGEEVEVVATTKNAYIKESISVDAACAGNPGVMEYKGVWTETGEIIFHSEEFPIGTNNLGEFLAIVDALRYSKEQQKPYVIYSDSQTALTWLKNKKVNTNLERNAQTERLWQKIDEALAWVKINTYDNPVLKWLTKEWGESRADFGRKSNR